MYKIVYKYCLRSPKMRKFLPLFLAAAALTPLGGCTANLVRGSLVATAGAPYDVVIANGKIVDGTGASWFWGDLAISNGRIVRIAPRGLLAAVPATRRIDAKGMVVAPGFIDIQAQSYENFMVGDGKAISMVTQGITTAILGEGDTPAPVNAKMLASMTDTTQRKLVSQFTGDHGFGRWLDFMGNRGLSQNVGSFVGSGTVRQWGKGFATGEATATELDSMRAMVRHAMQDGAFGIASALIYPPNSYSSTRELIETAKAMAPYGGLYITHMRNEGDEFLEALDEAIRVGKEGGVPVEVYHLKAAGPGNWPKMALAIAKIDSARRAGQDVQADMYLYVAGGNGFNACIAPKYAADGKLLENLANPATRELIKADLHRKMPGFDNLCITGGPENVMVTGFTRPELKQYEGKRLSEISAAMHKDWADVIIDLNIAEKANLGEILFLMSEDNLRMQIAQPWMKFGTDAGSEDPATAQGMTHPRGYGNYPRLFGKYVRDEKVVPLEDAVRKASAAVATRLQLHDRGVLKEGMRADVVVFDAATIRDIATFEKPHQLSVGMQYVLVNGIEVIRDGAHTGAKPGQVVRGAAWTGWSSPK